MYISSDCCSKTEKSKSNFINSKFAMFLKVKRRKEVSESTAVEGRVKRRRVEVGAETSCPQSGMDRSVDYKIVFQGTSRYFSCPLHLPRISFLCNPLPHLSSSFSSIGDRI